MRIAAVGCVHGELRRAYRAVEQAGGADAVVLCGDVQACRHEADLQSMSVPAKYRRMGDFHEYFSGSLRAPYLTVIVGGNHEASAYFAPLSSGGWVAPDMWYVGDAGLVQIDGVRIAGLSGIYFAPDADLPRFEPALFAKDPVGAAKTSALYSAYHTRTATVHRAAQFTDVDVVVTHDWPRGIEQNGNLQGLLARKPWFRSDIEKGELGNPLTAPLLDALQPRWWISAHLHTYFTAQAGKTRFVALDKVLPRRHFLEIIEINVPERGKSSSETTILR